MHAITPRLFSKYVYSVPLRALRLRVCVRLDRGGGGGGDGYQNVSWGRLFKGRLALTQC